MTATSASVIVTRMTNWQLTDVVNNTAQHALSCYLSTNFGLHTTSELLTSCHKPYQQAPHSIMLWSLYLQSWHATYSYYEHSQPPPIFQLVQFDLAKLPDCFKTNTSCTCILKNVGNMGYKYLINDKHV
jgi:hypothetical protein